MAIATDATHMVIKKAAILLSMFFLTSCSILSPVKIEPDNLYELNSTPKVATQKTSYRITLFVPQPVANPSYNTTDIAYTLKPYQISYFAKNHWVGTPGKMLQPLIVQTLQNTHYFNAVISPPLTGRFDFILNTQLIQLQQDFTQNPSVMRITLRAELVRTTNNQVIATRSFSMVEPTQDNTPYSGVIAANKATAKLLQRLAAFCTQSISADVLENAAGIPRPIPKY